MMKFKKVGTWWNDKDIELVEINDTVYALHGWNGEEYTSCWKCSGKYLMDASKEVYCVRPIYKNIGDDFFELVRYEIFQKGE